MTPSGNKGQRNTVYLLLVLLAVWGLVLFFQGNPFAGPERAPLLYKEGGGEILTASFPQKTGGAFSLRSDLLDPEPPQTGRTRDIFRTPLPTTTTTTRPRVFVPPTVYIPPKPRGPSPEELARKELKNFTLMGLMVRGGKKEAFLSRNGEPFDVEEGGTVTGTIWLKEIGEESVVIEDRPTGETLTLP